jgi:lipopolysaccharide export system protein LptC
MSEAAIREQAAKRHWAEPGSRHDQLVRAAKWGLPGIVVAFILLLAISPFDSKGDVSFILDKKDVDKAEERMRINQASYVGEDNAGNKFQITAGRAVQQSSDVPVVMIEQMRAQLALAQGPLLMVASKGSYDLDTQVVSVNGPVRVAGADGYKLETSDVTVNLKERHVASAGRVSGQMRLGQFEAGRMTADLGARTVTLTGGARLKIVQGAVR